MLRASLSGSRSRHDNGLDGLLEQPIIIHIRSGNDGSQGSAVSVRHEALFGAIFPTIRGVGTYRAPPKRALPNMQSAACHFHCTPFNSSLSLTKRAQSFLKKPTSHQS